MKGRLVIGNREMDLVQMEGNQEMEQGRECGGEGGHKKNYGALCTGISSPQ